MTTWDDILRHAPEFTIQEGPCEYEGCKGKKATRLLGGYKIFGAECLCKKHYLFWIDRNWGAYGLGKVNEAMYG